MKMETQNLKMSNGRMFFDRNQPFISFDVDGKHFALSLNGVSFDCEYGQNWNKGWTNRNLSNLIEDLRPTKTELLD